MLFQLAFKQIFRNGKRSLALLTSLVIGLTLINGINFAFDTNTRGELEKSFNSVKVDLAFTTTNNDNQFDDLRLMMDDIQSQEALIEDYFLSKSSVLYGNIVIATNQSIDLNSTSRNSNPIQFIGIKPEELLSVQRLNSTFALVNGTWSFPNASTVMISQQIATMFNLSVGDNFLLGFVQENSIYYNNIQLKFNITNAIPNLTVGGIYDPTSEFTFLSGSYGRSMSLWVDLPNFDEIWNSISNNTWYSQKVHTVVNVLLNHQKMQISDSQTMQKQIQPVITQVINRAGMTYAFQVSNSIVSRFQDVEMSLLVYRFLMLLLTIPVLILSIFLSITLNTQALESRRREIGLLRSKGFSQKEVYRMIIYEALCLGLVSGVLSIFSGYLSSESILNVTSREYVGKIPIQITNFTILFSIGLGIFIAIIPTIRAAKRFSKLSLTLTLQNYNESFESLELIRSKGDIFFVIQGILPIIIVIFNPKSTIYGPYEIQVLWAIIYPIITGTTLIAPFTLTYGISKFVTIKILPKFAKFTQKFNTKTDDPFIASSITRNPKRASRVIYIIATLMTFQIITSVVGESQRQYELDLIYFNTGSDLEVMSYNDYYYGSSQNVGNKNFTDGQKFMQDFPDQIQNTSQIVTIRSKLYGQQERYMYNSLVDSVFSWQYWANEILVYGIRPLEYYEVSTLKSTYFMGKNPMTVLKSLDSNLNGCLVDYNYAEAQGFKLNDTVLLGFGASYPENNEFPVAVQILGFYRLLPGMTTTVNPSFVLNLEYLKTEVMQNITSFSTVTLVKVKDGVNQTALKTEMLQKYPNQYYIYSLQERLTRYEEYQTDSQGYLTILNLFSIEFYFLLIIASVGVGILFYVTIFEKRREICLMRMKGFLKQDIISMQMREGITLIGLGLIISILGFFLAYVINLQLDQLTYGILAREYRIPWTIFIQYGVSIGIFLIIIAVTTLIETRHSDRGKIPQILRTY